MRSGIALAALICVGGGAAVAQGDTAMSFLVTSANPGRGADLAGLDGADAHCAALAESAGVPGRTWAAYLSTGEVDARDRIGSGPRYNAKGEKIADDVAALNTDG